MQRTDMRLMSSCAWTPQAKAPTSKAATEEHHMVGRSAFENVEEGTYTARLSMIDQVLFQPSVAPNSRTR